MATETNKKPGPKSLPKITKRAHEKAMEELRERAEQTLAGLRTSHAREKELLADKLKEAREDAVQLKRLFEEAKAELRSARDKLKEAQLLADRAVADKNMKYADMQAQQQTIDGLGRQVQQLQAEASRMQRQGDLVVRDKERERARAEGALAAMRELGAGLFST